MKKIICILLAALMILGLAACGTEETKTVDADATVKALIATEDFKNAKQVEAEDVELEYDITLEDCADFYMYEDVNNKNMFIVAVAKDEKSVKLMYAELEKIETQYAESITKSTYADIQQYADKVEKRNVTKDMNAYICIISSDSEASSKLIVTK